ncbi:nucleotidyltransferase family protein [Dysgonomonas sp. 511]|uniref:nucleotidyltransferase family protein n=1 Tax=Dysgonomonas sp. 511 TaxID=2302930 RepID=UPI0013CFD083|nr:nucleotidyltransferase family protein [Dysgonomonas sp. 511]NDV79329.1 D-mannose-1-phosphate guanyltransferase [Dysgonomonas sp. 511]
MRECIILAGGLGTRLQSVVNDVPKCMAEVAGKPFLEHLFNYVEAQKTDHVILSLGYKAEVVTTWLQTQNRPFHISSVIENAPLGTGGGIAFAFTKVKTNSAFIINGDTFFDVSLNLLKEQHDKNNAHISLALKAMQDFDRYGSVDVDTDGRIKHFNEKKYCKKGLINGGIYLVEKSIFAELGLPEKFSFEKDILEAHIGDMPIYGFAYDNYFIDIGIPEDFEKANRELKITDKK